ncbi:MAG: hypothetical protein JNL96_04670 [Planctomycetaceae bacterium]|nr:hypothetical protein [Planctomycetaceae bacterium]
MTWDSQLWRTAQRIEAAYLKCRGLPQALDVPWYAWQKLTAACRWAAEAERRGWRHAGARQREQLGRDLDYLLSDLRALRSSLESRQRNKLPTAGELYAELVAAEDEFGDVVVDDFELYVTTDPITLDGIYLGPFEIRLKLSRLDEPDPYRVVAVEPHPAQSSVDTTHPHVHNERICLGEGKAAVTAALAEGRLADLFQLINRVLHSYGEGSAYVELDRWHGTPCSECDQSLDEDDLYSCRGCDCALCGECVRVCDCGTAACHDCATHCYGCEETTCAGCLAACSDCEEEFCASCLEEGLCHACQAAEEERAAEREAELEAELAAEFGGDETEAAVHAARLGEVIVLARPRHHRNRRLRNLGRR